MSIYQKQHQRLLGVYERAHLDASDLAEKLEDHSVSVSAAGEHLVRPSSELIERADDLVVALKRWCELFETTAEIEKGDE